MTEFNPIVGPIPGSVFARVIKAARDTIDAKAPLYEQRRVTSAAEAGLFAVCQWMQENGIPSLWELRDEYASRKGLEAPPEITSAPSR